MEVNRRKRRRTDDPENPPKIGRKSSSRSSAKAAQEDEQYRRQIYAVSVRDALRKKSEGDTTAYGHLVHKFFSSAALKDVASTRELHLLVNALSHVVSHLDRRHAALVDAIISLQWASADDSFVKSYVSFIGLLLSAQSQYGNAVLERAVDGLTHQSDVSVLNVTSLEPGKRLTRRDLYNRHHSLLEHVLSIVPTLTKSLQPILARKFPHKRLEKVHHVTYIRNILRLAQYCPGLSDHILNSVIEKAIQIDVEIQVDLDELDDAGEAPEPIFALEDDPFDAEVVDTGDPDPGDVEEDVEEEHLSDISSEDEPDLDDDGAIAEAPRDTGHIRDMASKLDAVLRLVFDHLRASHREPLMSPSPAQALGDVTSLPMPQPLPPSPPPFNPLGTDHVFETQHVQFRTLLFAFDRVILRTSKSRYTQFLLFWFASLDAEFADEFLGTLIHKVITVSEAPAIRAAAASYLASFVSRANYVDGDSVRRVMGLLCTYLGRELELYAEQKEAVHISQFTPFYSVSQAVFLIFCFRWRVLQEHLEDGDVDEEANDDLGLNAAATNMKRASWITELDILQQVIVSPLNPLRFCDQSVSEQFAAVASKTNFAFCYSILEQNRRSAYTGVVPIYVLPPSPAIPQSGSGPTGGAGVSRTNSVTSVSGMSRSVFIASNPSPNASTSTRDTTAATIVELNGFFPFDPYELPLTRSYIDGIYRVWDEVKIAGDEDEDTESDEDEDEEEVKAPSQGGDSPRAPIVVESISAAGGSADDLNKSFGGMSISPMQMVLPKSFIETAA